MKQLITYTALSLLWAMMTACGNEGKYTALSTRFEQVSPDQSGVDFANRLIPTEALNMYTFRNFYNGGGVAVGDVNNDQLPDLFFTGNMTSNRLYLNQGEFAFVDITDKAGLNSEGYWSTGVSMVDINSDGFIDIFVTLSGPPQGDKRHNRLYLNNGDSTFREASKEWNLDHTGLGTSAVFFDADRDGYLDLLLLSNPIEPLADFQIMDGSMRKTTGGDLRYYRNTGTEFVEETFKAGFYQNAFSFPLSASVGDLNNDGWLDVYLANDFFERDYLYLNRNGIFEEVMGDLSYVRSSSLSSMGSDVADLDNDGRLDLYVADMRPVDERRMKSKMTFETWSEQQDQVNKGFGYQHTRNTLFRNIDYTESAARNSTTSDPAAGSRHNNEAFFLADLSRMTKTHATDWSWATLLADFDLNGWNDVFVTNGIGKDLLDQDYLSVFNNPNVIRERIESGQDDVILGLLGELSSEPLSNVLFSNAGNLQFEDKTVEWGLELPGYSSGAAWADLDLDGDLDLVMNQTDDVARIYENKTIVKGSGSAPDERILESSVTDRMQLNSPNWLRIDLKGTESNSMAIGARVVVWADNNPYLREHILQRGFQSSVEPGLFFGFGDISRVDSITVRWPEGDPSPVTYRKSIDLPARMIISKSEGFSLSDLTENEMKATRFSAITTDGGSRTPDDGGSTAPSNTASDIVKPAQSIPSLYFERQDPVLSGIDFVHKAFNYSDFRREPLLYHMRSTEGPALCKGDPNGDGLDDFYIGGARDQGGRLYIQNQNGTFMSVMDDLFDRHKVSEEVDCAFFDANQDGLDDLYIVSGGNSLVSASTALSDRFYLSLENDDQNRAETFQESLQPTFTLIHTEQLLPTSRTFESTSVVAPHDFTGDGIPDLFVGTRLKPFSVGVPVNGYLLEGDGAGNFQDVTSQWAPDLIEIGMITHAVWADMTGNGQAELIVAGEYMPIRIFEKKDGQFQDISSQLLPESTSGWWNRLITGDWNRDGQADLIGLNHGLNSIFRASEKAPVRLWVGDLSGNGLTEHILAIPKEGKEYPVALRHDLADILPFVGHRFPSYADYAGKTVQDIFTRQELESLLKLEAVMLDSRRFMSQKTSETDSDLTPLISDPLPFWAQVSPMYGAAVLDTDQGDVLIAGGNLYKVKPQVGSYDASVGVVIDLMRNTEIEGTGFQVQGEVREILPLTIGTSSEGRPNAILVALYDAPPLLFRIQRGSQ